MITTTTGSEAFTTSFSSSSSVQAASANNVVRLMVDDISGSDGTNANSLMGLMLNGIGFKSNVKQLALLSDEELKRPATATPKPPTTSLNDIFISVKTTKQNHDNRLELILNTWQQLAKQQVGQTLKYIYGFKRY